MVSALWKASSDGDLDGVNALLVDASPVDIELKDHTGSTPLIEAVKNGHVEVVRALLNKGADPLNASSQGRPEHYTQDAAILGLLSSAQQKLAASNEIVDGFPVTNEYASPPPPPGPYPYYPAVHPPMPPMGEPGVYYPPPPPPASGENGSGPNGIGHLPPPEIARMIPCRYFPACRYGPQCMFAHPQGPYYQGANMPPLPNQYPPFDPAPGPGPYAYYPPMPPPPQFQQPNGAPMTPLSPPPQPHAVHHGRSPSEIVSSSQPFPNGPLPPAPYVPLSPGSYPHPSVPMAGPPIPPLHLQPPPPGPGPQSPTLYHNIHTIPPFPGPDASGQYMPPPAGPGYAEPDGAPRINGQQEVYSVHPIHREGSGHRRGTIGRRGSFAGKKPPCLFYPAGRCKNGDECRFPHVLENTPAPNHVQPFYPPRGVAPRPPRNHSHQNGPGVVGLEQKMGNMAIRDDAPRVPNGVAEPSRAEYGGRPRYQGPKHQANGLPHKRAGAAPRVQRVPSADDFPVLPGSVTPPRVNGVNGHIGPTAAQVLRAPAPVRKEASEEATNAGSTRGPSPDANRLASPEETNEPAKVESTRSTPAPAAEDVQAQQPQSAPQKLPVSFAAAAAASAAVPATESTPRVAVSA